MSHAELKHSDFLLHADLGRFEAYKKNQKLWWSKQLNKWMCMNPELIQFILNSENFRVHEYNIERLERRFGIFLPHTINMIAQNPLALNGEGHKTNRKKLAIEIQQNSKKTLLTFEQDLVELINSFGRVGQSGDLIAEVLKPTILKGMLNLSGLSGVNVSKDFEILSEIFDVTATIERRLAIETTIEAIYDKLPDTLAEDEKYLKIATLALGTESLLSTLALSVVAVFERHEGSSLKEMVWGDKITATAVPIIERVAKSNQSIGGVDVAQGQAVRLFLEVTGFDENGGAQYSQLFFGSGQHMCLGTFVGNEMWKIIGKVFSKVDKRIKIRELEVGDSYSFNSLTKLVVGVL